MPLDCQRVKSVAAAALAHFEVTEECRKGWCNSFAVVKELIVVPAERPHKKIADRKRDWWEAPKKGRCAVSVRISRTCQYLAAALVGGTDLSYTLLKRRRYIHTVERREGLAVSLNVETVDPALEVAG